MPSNTLQVVPTTMSEIESELETIYQRVEVDQWRTAQLFWSARQMIIERHPDEPKIQAREFKTWYKTKTHYSDANVVNYVTVFEKFKDNSAIRNAKKPIPFRKLRPLAAPDVGSRTVDTVVKKLASANPPSKEDIQDIVKKAKPEYRPPPIVYIKPFEERIANTLDSRFKLRPEILLEVNSTSSAELIRIVARHWKGKYHPDKDGDPDIFNQIVQAEKDLLALRGAK